MNIAILPSLSSDLSLYWISGRLGALQQKFGAAQETGSSLDSERVGRLDEMIALGERSKPLYSALPDTIARLESLQQLHLQAGEFSNNLLQLDSLQTQLSLQLANNLSLLQVNYLAPYSVKSSNYVYFSKQIRSSKKTRQISIRISSLCSRELKRFRK